MTGSNPPDGKPVDDINRLRNLVLGEEKDRLHKLDQRVSDLESRTSDVAEVLPAAMDRLVEDPASLPDMERPLVNTIRGAIQRDTESFAEALFPVLGPAIRRAVADALKGLVQRINAALESSFTIKGLKWRLEAVRSGVPFAQIVLRHTMIYAIQEVFLIQRDSGLILASVHRDELLTLDEDAVAAMLTAIQSFIQDSFGLATDEPLRSAELGDRTIWVINGPAAALACVISGTPPRAVRNDLMSLLEAIHARFGNRLTKNPDQLMGDKGLLALMNEALREEVDDSESRSSGSRYRMLWIAGGLLLLLYFLFASYSTWRDTRFTRLLVDLFDKTPGYVITSVETHDGVVNIGGLRDPDSIEPTDLLNSRQLPSSKMATDFSPYLSLEPELVTRRLARRWQLDRTVSLRLDDNVLSVNGVLTSRQLAGLQGLIEYHPHIREVVLEGVNLEAGEAAGLARSALTAPDSITLQPADGQLMISGLSDAAWYSSAQTVDIEIPGWKLNFDPLAKNLSAQLDDVIKSLDGRVFKFSDGNKLMEQSRSSLGTVSIELVRAQGLSSALGVPLRVDLRGSADGTDSREKNRRVSGQRGRRVRDELAAEGVVAEGITLSIAEWTQGNKNLDLRKVTLLISREK